MARAEDTARILFFHHLTCPYPGVEGSINLVELLKYLSCSSSGRLGFDTDYRSMLRLLISNRENSSSLASTISAMRDGMRSASMLLPEEVWRYALRLRALAAEMGRVAPGRLYEQLDEFIRLSRSMTGAVTTSMRRDMGFHFWRCGRQLEYADMTCRLLLLVSQGFEANSSGHLDADQGDSIKWMKTLKALGIVDAYRNSTHAPINAASVADFVVKDQILPRSIRYCLSDVRASLELLPTNAEILKALEESSRLVDKFSGRHAWKKHLKYLQPRIISVAKAIDNAYFKDI